MFKFSCGFVIFLFLFKHLAHNGPALQILNGNNGVDHIRFLCQ